MDVDVCSCMLTRQSSNLPQDICVSPIRSICLPLHYQYHKRSQHTRDSLRSIHILYSAVPVVLLLLQLSLLPASLHDHLLAQDLASSPTTPRAHWRQQPIKGRALFHVHDLQCRKTMIGGWRRAEHCTQAISLHKTWSPACPHQEHTGHSSPSKYVLPQRDPTMQQCDSSCDSCDSATVRQCDTFATVRHFCNSATVATV